jgi:hypothetical protein
VVVVSWPQHYLRHRSYVRRDICKVVRLLMILVCAMYRMGSLSNHSARVVGGDSLNIGKVIEVSGIPPLRYRSG